MRYGEVMDRISKISLRRFLPEDAPRLLQIMGDDGHKMLQPSTLEAANGFLAAPFDQFAVLVQGAIAGEIHLIKNQRNASAELGYVTAREYEGQGIATEAIREISRYGFQELQLHRLWARTSVRNIGSWHALKRAGLIEEATLRESRRIGDEFVDEVIYRLLRTEWIDARGRM